MSFLTDHNLPSLEAQLSEWGLPTSHALRLLRAFYRSHGVPDFGGLELGRPLLARLVAELPLRQSQILSRHQSADGTVKLLLSLHHGGTVETVLMPAHRPGVAAGCVSSQIGCAMGCDFCASTKAGLERNLSAGEIVEQFLHLREQAAIAGRRLKTLVFMGMGEPMHNLDQVLEAVRRIAGPNMGELGWKQITISTVGIVPGIDALAEADLNVHLALSLHAPDDATRAELVPMNKRYKVADIMAAARRFQDRTRRIVTLEYCMLAGINDSDNHAHALAKLLDGFRAHVNLIPYNPIGLSLSGKRYEKPAADRVRAFLSILRDANVVTHVRDTRGDDVNAACGQLRHQLVQLTAPV